MPSDLVAPGALAFESIPARSEEYAKPGVKRELARIFRRDGCHHCGEGAGVVRVGGKWLGEGEEAAKEQGEGGGFVSAVLAGEGSEGYERRDAADERDSMKVSSVLRVTC